MADSGILVPETGIPTIQRAPSAVPLFKKKFNSCICLWLCWVFVALWAFTLVVVLGLLIAVAPLVAEHRLYRVCRLP